MIEQCASCGKAASIKCQGCSAVAYCTPACKANDAADHAHYCPYVAFWDSEAQRQTDTTYTVNVNSPALAAKLSPSCRGNSDYIFHLLAPKLAMDMANALRGDLLPADETQEKIWGLYGSPSSPGYQRLYRAYAWGFKYGDLNAQKLAEAIVQKPNASAALTEMLQNVRIVATEQDVPDAIYTVIDNYRPLVQGLEVKSEFDQWPIRR